MTCEINNKQSFMKTDVYETGISDHRETISQHAFLEMIETWPSILNKGNEVGAGAMNLPEVLWYVKPQPSSM